MDAIGRKRLPHEPPWSIDSSQEIFFLTICTQNREERPLLRDGVAAGILEAMKFYSKQGKWWVFLAVVMPDHVHLLARFPGDFISVVRAWKRWTAHHLAIHWQRDFFDHRLRQDEKLRETAQYILQNPVRAGLVQCPEDWPHIFTAEGFLDR